MKKLMIAAAATLCAAVGFSDGVASTGVTSVNTVGYTTTTLADDSQAVACGFIEVGGSGINLTSIKPEADGTCNGDIYIEMLNSAGYTTDTYYWYQNARGMEDGWYNDDGDKIGDDVEDITFTPGTGLWLTGIEDNTMTTAGQVYSSDLSITLQDDSQMLGNPYAAPIGLAANIEVEADGTCNGDIYIEMLNSAGYTTDTYYWYQNARGMEDGWYNDDGDLIGDDVEDITFPAGTGLWVSGLDGALFNITSPIVL